VSIVVNIPPGADGSGIPEGYHLRGPFVHKAVVLDVDGVTVITPAVTSINWHIDVRLSGPAADLDRDNDGVDEITRSKIKTWLTTVGTELTRASLNPDHVGLITYYERTLAGGDWVRLYPNISSPKHAFFGGRSL
jgi:hypothetical protein